MTTSTPARYKDIDFKMRNNPITGDVLTLDDTTSIRQSLMLLFMTRFYDRPMQPQIGSWVQGILFQPNDDISKENLRTEITTVCNKFEPRVQILAIEFSDSKNNTAYHDSVVARIGYNIINTDIIDSVNLVIKRSR